MKRGDFMKLGFRALKEKHRYLRGEWDGYNPRNTSLRVHRALSWLKSAEEVGENIDLGFISLWISFNALYGVKDLDQNYENERSLMKKFFINVLQLDEFKVLADFTWNEYSNLHRIFINNQYVFHPFWTYMDGQIDEESWESKLEKSINESKGALTDQNILKFLEILFDRLYVLRNQLMHGGATYNGKVNREQVGLGYQILSKAIPSFIDVLLENPNHDWGLPTYLPVDESMLM